MEFSFEVFSSSALGDGFGVFGDFVEFSFVLVTLEVQLEEIGFYSLELFYAFVVVKFRLHCGLLLYLNGGLEICILLFLLLYRLLLFSKLFKLGFIRRKLIKIRFIRGILIKLRFITGILIERGFIGFGLFLFKINFGGIVIRFVYIVLDRF